MLLLTSLILFLFSARILGLSWFGPYLKFFGSYPFHLLCKDQLNWKSCSLMHKQTRPSLASDFALDFCSETCIIIYTWPILTQSWGFALKSNSFRILDCLSQYLLRSAPETCYLFISNYTIWNLFFQTYYWYSNYLLNKCRYYNLLLQYYTQQFLLAEMVHMWKLEKETCLFFKA